VPTCKDKALIFTFRANNVLREAWDAVVIERTPLTNLLPLSRFNSPLLETKAIFRKTAEARRELAELKGVPEAAGRLGSRCLRN